MFKISKLVRATFFRNRTVKKMVKVRHVIIVYHTPPLDTARQVTGNPAFAAAISSHLIQ